MLCIIFFAFALRLAILSIPLYTVHIYSAQFTLSALYHHGRAPIGIVECVNVYLFYTIHVKFFDGKY